MKFLPPYMTNIVYMIIALFVMSLLTYVCIKCFRNKKAMSESFTTSDKTLIFFKANWCGHCNRFKPVWDEFALECQQNNIGVKVLELDIDEEETKPLMEKHNVRGFPHVVLVEENKDDIVFTKNRTKEELFAFLNEHMM